MVRHILNLIVGRLQRLGLLDADARLDPDTSRQLDALGTQHAAAIQGLIPFGKRAGRHTARLARVEDEVPRPPARSREWELDAAGRGTRRRERDMR